MVQNLDLEGKIVLIRVDFNVPVEKGEIKDFTRIEKEMDNIRLCDKMKARQIILMSHFGKPQDELKKGKGLDEVHKNNTLKPVADYLATKFDDFAFVEDCLQADIPNHKYILLENLRFYPDEEKNSIDFAKKLSHNADVYVNDAFGASHRAHASIVAIPEYFKSVGKPVAAGLLLQTEDEHLRKLIENPSKPFTAVLGGAKVADKIGAIEGLLDAADNILIGGGMAYTFLKYEGYNIGNSIFASEIEIEENGKKVKKPYNEVLNEIYKKAEGRNVKIILPVDHIVADKIDKDANSSYNKSVDVPEGLIGVDIGKKTIKEFSKIIKSSKTIFWNGPLGVFENEFGEGTKTIAEAIAKNKKAFTVLGGGDTITAVNKFGIDEREYGFVSTGGGASLDYIQLKGKLPGIVVLQK
jgi:phosphoglycerate kinase